MDSTLIAPATPATTCAPAVVDALALPAAAAPAALVTAVESWLSRKTSARGTAVLAGTPGGGSTPVLGGERGSAVTAGPAAQSHADSATPATPASSVDSAAAHAAGPAMSFRNRYDVQGSPSRGTPV